MWLKTTGCLGRGAVHIKAEVEMKERKVVKDRSTE
jgi:hypothetical protein